MGILDICYVPFNSWLEGKIQLTNIMNMTSVKKMFLDFYSTKVFLGKLEPIEKLPVEDKMKLWELTKEFPDKETRIDACRIYWTMEYMAAQKLKNDTTETN